MTWARTRCVLNTNTFKRNIMFLSHGVPTLAINQVVHLMGEFPRCRQRLFKTLPSHRTTFFNLAGNRRCQDPMALSFHGRRRHRGIHTNVPLAHSITKGRALTMRPQLLPHLDRKFSFRSRRFNRIHQSLFRGLKVSR